MLNPEVSLPGLGALSLGALEDDGKGGSALISAEISDSACLCTALRGAGSAQFARPDHPLNMVG